MAGSQLQILLPWFQAIHRNPQAFEVIMTEMGISFDVNGWTTKDQVVSLTNQICKTGYAQRDIWKYVWDSRKSDDFYYLFPTLEGENSRKRSVCYSTEAWFAVTLMCCRANRLHLWLRHFNLTEDGELLKAEKLIFVGTQVKINGLTVEGAGLVEV